MGKGTGSGEGAGDGAGDGSGAYKGKSDRLAVPAMPMPLAVVCCVLNFIIPGFGTILAGFANFCCTRNEDMNGSTRCVSCLINWAVGCGQLITAILCLVGWCWSCVWGIYFIGMSVEYYHNNKVDDVDQGSPGHVYNNQSGHVVVIQAGASSNVVASQPGQTFGPQPGQQFVQNPGPSTSNPGVPGPPPPYSTEGNVPTETKSEYPPPPSYY